MVIEEKEIERIMSSAGFQANDEPIIDKDMLGGLRVEERKFGEYECSEFILSEKRGDEDNNLMEKRCDRENVWLED